MTGATAASGCPGSGRAAGLRGSPLHTRGDEEPKGGRGAAELRVRALARAALRDAEAGN